MSCNPAIGGLAKGQIVREIDALDGVMGTAIDRAGIQFRVLNRSKGPAVHGPRAQADRMRYRQAMQALLRAQPGLSLREASVDDLILAADGGVRGVATANGDDHRLRRGGADDRNVSARESFTSASGACPPAGSASGANIGLSSTLRRGRLRAGPTEDRHAAPPRRAEHPLAGPGGPARR